MSVQDGPTLTSSGELAVQEEVDAVDSLNINAIPGKITTVSVQSGDLEDIEFFYIASDQYGDGAAATISYTFSDETEGTDGSQTITLEKPHMLTSGNLMKLFIKAPKEIMIDNKTTSDAHIDIVLARKAVTAVA